jgi:hypothetical protein
MTPMSTSGSSSSAARTRWPPTAPDGNGAQPSHEYVLNRTAPTRGDPLPTGTTVEVSRPFRPGPLLEVDLTAVVPGTA